MLNFYSIHMWRFEAKPFVFYKLLFGKEIKMSCLDIIAAFVAKVLVWFQENAVTDNFFEEIYFIKCMFFILFLCSFSSASSPVVAHPKAELIYGQQVNLSCSTGDQLPNDMKLNWTSPKTSSSYTPYPTHITVLEVGKEDNGKWGCELWQGGNKLTSDEILLKIGEHGKWDEQEVWHGPDLVTTKF